MLRWDDIAMTTVQLDHLRQIFFVVLEGTLFQQREAGMSIRIAFRSRRKTDRDDVYAG